MRIRFDEVCPTVHELPDELRRFLPLAAWAAHHRLVCGVFNEPYVATLGDLEVAGLLHQAGFSVAGIWNLTGGAAS